LLGELGPALSFSEVLLEHLVLDARAVHVDDTHSVWDRVEYFVNQSLVLTQTVDGVEFVPLLLFQIEEECSGDQEVGEADSSEGRALKDRGTRLVKKESVYEASGYLEGELG